jgi:DNA repair exonuclease SbcCD nuclease subunit
MASAIETTRDEAPNMTASEFESGRDIGFGRANGSSGAEASGRNRDIVLVHTSDLHVDDGHKANAHDGTDGLRSVLATARSLEADIVLLVGDTFDNHRVPAPILRQAAEMLEAAGRPVVILPGNHDPALPNCLFRKAGITDLPNVHILGITDPDAVQFDAYELEIWGHAHRDFNDMTPLRAPRPRTTRWQVALAHGHYAAPAEWQEHAHRSWLISDQDLAATEAHYIALGHWDRAVSVGDGTVPAYYSGSPELAKTVNVVRLSPAEGVVIHRHPVDWG